MASTPPSRFFHGALTPAQCKTMESLADRWHRVAHNPKTGVVEVHFYQHDDPVIAIISKTGALLKGSTCQPPLREKQSKPPSPRDEMWAFLDTLQARSS